MRESQKSSLMMLAAFAAFFFFASSFAFGKTSALLKDIESHYKDVGTVKMDVKKTVRVPLLDRVKISEGTILIKKGKLRWETDKPQHTLVLADGKTIWLADFPTEPGEPVRVIKAVNVKKTQPQAVVAFLLGKGRISDEFAVISEKSEEDLTKIDLKPRQASDQFKWLTLFADIKTKNIQKMSFEDNADNITELAFANIKFGEPIDDKEFKYQPPKNAEIEVVH